MALLQIVNLLQFNCIKENQYKTGFSIMCIKDVFIDLDDTFLDYKAGCNAVWDESPEIVYPQSQYRFYANLEPLEGAVDFIKAIEADPRYTVQFCTAPSFKNRLCYTEKADSIFRILGEEWLERLYIAPDKSKMGDGILIDNEISGRGQERYKGELIHFGSARFPDWRAVLEHLGITSS